MSRKDNSPMYRRFFNMVFTLLWVILPPSILRTPLSLPLSGIGNPKPFLATLRERYEVVQEMTLEDHHVYKVRDLNRLRELLARWPGAVIVTTEKDAVKLTNRAKIPEEIRRSIYYLPINISFIEDSATDFLQKLEEDVRGN